MISHAIIKNNVTAIEHYLNNDIEASNYYNEKSNVFKTQVCSEHLQKYIQDNNLNETDCFAHFSNRKRVGTDFTLSLDKSISLLAFQNESVRQLCRDIAIDTVNNMKNDVYVRLQKNNQVVYEQAKDCLFSIYEHNTSRELDPQLHYHCFLHNKVLANDNNFYAAQCNKLVENKFYYNVIANYKLTVELQKQGYNSYLDKNGNAKINVDENILQQYSKRTQQIKSAVDNYDELTREQKQSVKLSTRKNKEHIDINDLQNEIQHIDFSKSKRIYDTNIDTNDLETVYNKTVNELTDKQGIFTKETFEQKFLINLSNHSKENNKQLIEYEHVSQFINQKFENLIAYKDNTKIYESHRYSTFDYYKLEKDNSQLATELFSNSKVITTLQNTYKNIKKFESVNNIKLTQEQKDAIVDVLCNKQLSVLQGYAGTGKTAAAKCISEIAQSNNYKIITLAPTGKATEELGKAINSTQTQTIDSFLLTKDKNLDSNTILFVDEAGMLNSKQANQLLQLAKQYNCKIVLQGDIKQLKAVTAGDTFHDIQQQHKDKVIYITDIRRQQVKEYRDFAKAVAEKQFDNVIDYIKNNKDKVKDNNDLDEIANSYSNNNIIVTTKNSTKDLLNQKIREKLKFKNEKTFLLANKRDINDITDLNTNCFYVSGNKMLRVKSIDTSNNTVTFENNVTKKFSELDNFIEVSAKQLAVNDRVIALKNDKDLNIKNGEMFYIVGINKNTLTLENENKKITVDTRKYNYFDYAYAITSYKSQGLTVKNAIVVDDGNMNYNHFYVAVTRAKQSFQLYTNDIINTLYRAQFEQKKSTAQSLKSKSTEAVKSRDEIAKQFIRDEHSYKKYSKHIDNVKEKQKIKETVFKNINKTQKSQTQLRR